MPLAAVLFHLMGLKEKAQRFANSLLLYSKSYGMEHSKRMTEKLQDWIEKYPSAPKSIDEQTIEMLRDLGQNIRAYLFLEFLSMVHCKLEMPTDRRSVTMSTFVLSDAGLELEDVFQYSHGVKFPADTILDLGITLSSSLNCEDGYLTGIFGPIPIVIDRHAVYMFSYSAPYASQKDPRLKKQSLVLFVFFVSAYYLDHNLITKLGQTMTELTSEIKDVQEAREDSFKAKLHEALNTLCAIDLNTL